MITTLRNSQASAALKLAGGIINDKSPLPVLKNVLIDGADGRIRFAATNNDMSVEAFCDGEIETPGAATVSEETLSNLLAGIAPSAEVKLALTQDGKRVEVSSGRSSYRLPALDATDYPALPDAGAAEEKATLTMPLGALREALRRVLWAAGEEKERPLLMTVMFRPEADSTVLMATLGTKLAHLRIPTGAEGELGRQYLVPTKALAMVKGFPGDDGTACEITLAPSLTRFATADWRLTTRLVDGQYPKVEKQIPERGTTRWEMDGEEFAGACRRLLSVAKNQTRGNAILGTLRGLVLELKNVGADLGEGTEEVMVSATGEDPGPICFNVALLHEAAQVCGKTLVMEVNGGETAILMRPVGDETLRVVVCRMAMQG